MHNYFNYKEKKSKIMSIEQKLSYLLHIIKLAKKHTLFVSLLIYLYIFIMKTKISKIMSILEKLSFYYISLNLHW